MRPFADLNDACGRYASLYSLFQALNHDLNVLSMRESPDYSAAENDEISAFKAVRLTFVTQLNEMTPVEVPFSKQILKAALVTVSGQLKAVTEEIRSISTTAADRLAEVQCRASPNSPSVPSTGSGSQ